MLSDKYNERSPPGMRWILMQYLGVGELAQAKAVVSGIVNESMAPKATAF